MSITSFSKPSDADVLKNIEVNRKFLDFVGKGIVLQNTDETRYIRTIKVIINDEEVLQNVVYVKSGINWLFKKTETVLINS
ncbi:hypothetical protein UMM65_05520 [Aureibaculum sp. 2210JD6-5]|uniref:hypothetical protein n=1 Tax=Aureibaculum sp. 2210JD6-5 TaxID=3103957 RepID=UPI002AAE758C|nr:hypothetical protein [Aureibaculum sp. 2210JD6-5]MDY7394692.1 hypothetical protein [Aureibaculum sp. 2210JD6-5]